MATIDLGKLGFVNKGTYNNSTTYEKNDLVQFTDGGILSTYLYIDSTAQSGQAPSSSGTAGSRWVYFAKGVADAIASAGNNKVLVTDGSGNLSPLSIGSAGQVVKVNSGANGFEFGTGFDGNYKLHHVERYSYTGGTISVGSVTNGDADNQRNCIVINGGNYLTITPAHADDYFRFEAGVNYYIPANNAYGGLGFMTSTATDFSANRNFFFRSGQHSMGNGTAGGDEYNFEWIHWAGKCSEIGLTAGTTYYVRTIGQKHSTSNTLIFCGGQGDGNDRKHFMAVQHWKKN